MNAAKNEEIVAPKGNNKDYLQHTVDVAYCNHFEP
jgi:hypothetical protein